MNMPRKWNPRVLWTQAFAGLAVISSSFLHVLAAEQAFLPAVDWEPLFHELETTEDESKVIQLIGKLDSLGAWPETLLQGMREFAERNSRRESGAAALAALLQHMPPENATITAEIIATDYPDCPLGTGALHYLVNELVDQGDFERVRSTLLLVLSTWNHEYFFTDRHASILTASLSSIGKPYLMHLATGTVTDRMRLKDLVRRSEELVGDNSPVRTPARMLPDLDAMFRLDFQASTQAAIESARDVASGIAHCSKTSSGADATELLGFITLLLRGFEERAKVRSSIFASQDTAPPESRDLIYAATEALRIWSKRSWNVHLLSATVLDAAATLRRAGWRKEALRVEEQFLQPIFSADLQQLAFRNHLTYYMDGGSDAPELPAFLGRHKHLIESHQQAVVCALALTICGDFESARTYFELAESIPQSQLGAEHKTVAQFLAAIANASCEYYDEAFADLAKAEEQCDDSECILTAAKLRAFLLASL